MGIVKILTGHFDIVVEVREGQNTNFEDVRAYEIDGAGVHFLASDDAQHFIPHQNIKWFTIREHDDGGGWK